MLEVDVQRVEAVLAMRTISTLDTRRTVIDATSSPRASLSFSGFRTSRRSW
jgi:hypothetical protein